MALIVNTGVTIITVPAGRPSSALAMEMTRGSFEKLGQRASAVGEAARNFNAAYEGIMMLLDNTKPRISVAQTYRQPTRAERADQHRLEMQTRKARRAARTEGFDPVANKRVSQAYTAARTMLQMNPMYANDPMAAHNQAIRMVRAKLPPLRRDFFQPRRRTSKQDTVEGYCKPNRVPKPRYAETEPGVFADVSGGAA